MTWRPQKQGSMTGRGSILYQRQGICDENGRTKAKPGFPATRGLWRAMDSSKGTAVPIIC